MSIPEKAIKLALEKAGKAVPGIQPCVLMQREIDHTKVLEYRSMELNDRYYIEFLELQMFPYCTDEEEWIIFRIQTELHLVGHKTMIYIAKIPERQAS